MDIATTVGSLTNVITYAIYGIVGALCLAALVLIPLNALMWMRFGTFYRLCFTILFRGGKMVLHNRGINIDAIHVKSLTTGFELKDNDGKIRKFNIPSDSVSLFAGIPTTLAIDELPNTFKPTKVLEMAEQMTNAHLQNIKRFGVPRLDADGKMLVNRIAVLNDEGKPVFNAEGQQLFNEVPIIDYPIDQRVPGYKIPDFLTAQDLAEQIEIEKMITEKAIKEKSDKTLLYMGAAVAFCLAGLAALAMVIMYAPKQAKEVVEVTTTLVRPVVHTFTSTTFPFSPPPMV